MKPGSFTYHAPETVDETLALLAEYGDEGKVLAGGQSLVPMLALRLARPEHLIDIGRVESLRSVVAGDGALALGARTRHADLITDPAITGNAPLFSLAAPHIGHFQIRNRGTLGGSLAHGDSAAELPAVAVALDAEIEVASVDGSRRIPAADFFEATYLTVLDDTELVTAVHVPTWGAGSGFSMQEFVRRSGDFALAGVACGVRISGGVVDKAAIALLSMGSTPLRLTAAEEAIVGNTIDSLDLATIAADALADIDPPTDIHATGQFRRRVASKLVADAVAHAAKEAIQ